ncbi:MAG: CPBP family intramembrane metalloprotease [Atopobiaceae bacterium]|nr:CPBP family intramembrane metalloprotease [Atopobiaceae bacterium]
MDDKTFGKKVRSEACKVFVLAILLVIAQVVFQIIGFVLVLLLGIPEDSMWASIIPEALCAAGAVASVKLLGASSWTKLSREDVGYAFRFGWWCLAVSLGLMVYDLVYYAIDQTPVVSNWPELLCQCALLCLLIGFCEEYVFRGLILNALLALLGYNHRGVMASVFITSLAFGLAHVDLAADFADPLSAVQAVLKIVQTGMYSILLCTIVLRTHKLQGASLFHAFDDFVLLLPSMVLYGESLDIDYVVEGDSVWPTILNYLIVIALYLPFVIKSLRELHRGQDVYRGAFMEQRIARLEAQRDREHVVAVADVPPVPSGYGEVLSGGHAPRPH